MTQNYLMKLTSSQMVKVIDADLPKLLNDFSDRATVVVSIGDKVVSKNLIVWIAKAEAVDNSNANLLTRIGESLLGVQVADVAQTIRALTDEINQKQHILIESDVLFNRSYFHYAEPNVVNA